MNIPNTPATIPPTFDAEDVDDEFVMPALPGPEDDEPVDEVPGVATGEACGPAPGAALLPLGRCGCVLDAEPSDESKPDD